MRILVTGSAGFIGSHLVDELIHIGHEVFGCDNFVGGFERNINPLCQHAAVELCNKISVEHLFEVVKPEVVFHLACYPYEGLSQFSPVEVGESVLMASLNVFKNCVNNNVKRVVHFSSMARYGRRNKPPFSEDMPRDPCDVYGAAKVASEVSLEAISEATGLDYNILVPHNISGSRMRLDDAMRGVLGIWVNCLANDRPFHIYGDGEQMRAFSHVSDIILPCVLAGLEPSVSKQIINLGAEKALTLNEVAQVLLNTFGSKLQPIYAPDRPCESKYAYCTVGKSKRLLGFMDTKSLEDIFIDIIKDAKKFGKQEFRYKDLEITKGCPEVWLNRKI
jgi:UDP-glucose 4-epimerase